MRAAGAIIAFMAAGIVGSLAGYSLAECADSALRITAAIVSVLP